MHTCIPSIHRCMYTCVCRAEPSDATTHATCKETLPCAAMPCEKGAATTHAHVMFERFERFPGITHQYMSSRSRSYGVQMDHATRLRHAHHHLSASTSTHTHTHTHTRIQYNRSCSVRTYLSSLGIIRKHCKHDITRATVPHPCLARYKFN